MLYFGVKGALGHNNCTILPITDFRVFVPCKNGHKKQDKESIHAEMLNYRYIAEQFSLTTIPVSTQY